MSPRTEVEMRDRYRILHEGEKGTPPDLRMRPIRLRLQVGEIELDYERLLG